MYANIKINVCNHILFGGYKNEIIHLYGTDADANKSKVFWFSEFILYRKNHAIS